MPETLRYYILMNVNDERWLRLLRHLDPNSATAPNGPIYKKNLSSICQDFGQSFRDSLEEEWSSLQNKKLVLCLRTIPHPRVCVLL